MTGVIKGTGSCVPGRILTNEDLTKLVDTSDAWIQERTGIRQRHIAVEETTVSLAVEAEEGSGFLPAAYSDGAAGEALTLGSLHAGSPFRQEAGTDSAWMKMDGQAVFKFAVRRVPQVIEEVLEKNQISKETISHYVLHQANRRIVEVAAKRLQEPLGKFPMNLQEYGNTSSASIPILLDELNRSGELKKGEGLVLAGFGGGLTWGAAVTEWKKD